MTVHADSSFERIRQTLAAEYELLHPLGHGGMAAVYLARERALKRLVAIKVLDPELGASPVFRARFEREVETAAQLQHPHIVPIHRVGEIDGTAFFVMAHVDGENLADRMRHGPLAPQVALRIAREVADALRAAHRRGIIHRDIKPQNVLLERETGRALVTDFGIAAVAVAGEPAAGEGDDPGRLTGAGMVMGTPRYMSPEQASGERDLSPAADLYSLGVVLYEMLTGAYPFRVATPPNYLLAHLTQAPIPMVTRVGDMPRELERVVQRLLAKDPADRYPSADAALAALEDARPAAPGRTPAAERPVRGARLRRWRALGLGLAALLVLGLVWQWGVRLGWRYGRMQPMAGGRQSILVGFFDNTTEDPNLRWLRVGGVEYLGQSLGRWRDLQVVDAERLLDLARRAKLPDDRPLSRDDVLDLAREAGVGTAAVGTILKLADTLQLTVRVYDVATGRQLSTATAKAADDAALPGAFNSLADQILQLSGAPQASLREVEPPTRSIAAYRAYTEGIQARSRWELDRAAEAFRRAIRADSSFALAYYELSQAIYSREYGSPNPTFVAFADSALRWAEGRPAEERGLIEAFHAFVHADFPRARRLYAALLARDSTIADAWSGLASSAQLDLTLRRDARGREVLPASFATALRGYERALALDGSDHRVYAAAAQLLLGASLETSNTVPAYREPPPGAIHTFAMRPVARRYAIVMVSDTLAAVPSESVALRWRKPVLDSLRARARARARDVLERWITIAPDEGQAYLYLSELQRFDKEYDAALVSLDRAGRLGTPDPVPVPIIRLDMLLDAKRVAEARPLGDSLAAARRGAAPESPQATLFSSPVVNYLFAVGRTDEAMRLARRFSEAYRGVAGDAEVRRSGAVGDLAVPLRVAADLGELTPAEFARRAAELERGLATLPDSARARTVRAVGLAVVQAAASIGDTAAVRRWRARSEHADRRGLDAWAALVAGDRAGAERLFAAAAADTSRAPSHVYALAVTAEGLGRRDEARRLYGRLDTLDFQGPAVNSDWVLVGRAYEGRARLAEAAGDTAEAARWGRRFVDLWARADPPARTVRDRAAKRLAELTRADRER